MYAALVLLWWQADGSFERVTFSCTYPLTSSTMVERWQMQFFKSSVWPDRESNRAYQLQRHVLNVVYHLAQCFPTFSGLRRPTEKK